MNILSLPDIFRRPSQNQEAIERYLASGQPLTLFDWECPPRFLDSDSAGKPFVSYDVDLDSIFAGKAIDEFTELPRALRRKEDEVRTLARLQETGIAFRYVKLVADTNATFLTPESVGILGEARVRSKFAEFVRLLEEFTADYPVPVQVATFTSFLDPVRAQYEESFASALALLKKDPELVLPKGVYELQLQRTREHMGMQDQEQVEAFALRTIASYAAEGMAFTALEEAAILPRAVWLNFEEADSRTIAITDCLRLSMGKGALPMLFP